MAETKTGTGNMSTKTGKATTFTQRAKKSTETEGTAKTEKTATVYTEEQLNAIVAKAVAEAIAKVSAASSASAPAPIVQIAKEEYVTLCYIGLFAKGTSVVLGGLGRITTPGGSIDVSKKEFLQNIGLPVVDGLLRDKSLIVVSGLTDEERERFGLAYADGSVLGAKEFFDLLNYDGDKICALFEGLCEEHKKVVAHVYFSAYFENDDNRINEKTVKRLNKLSKCDKYRRGMFMPIIEDMGGRFADDEEEDE